MNVVGSLLIVAAFAAAPTDAAPSGTVELFRCDFESAWDTNHDQWPDRWVRKRDPGFPAYINIRIEPETAKPDNHVLQVDLDGGAAAIFSPEIVIRPGYSYSLAGKIRTAGLKSDRAFLSLAFLDKDRRRVETICSRRIHDATETREVTVGPVAPVHSDVRYAILGLHLEPLPAGPRLEGSTLPDLKGTATFDDLVLVRLPRMELRSSHPANVFPPGATPQFTCRVTGLPASAPVVKFALQDLRGATLAAEEVPLTLEEEPAGARAGEVHGTAVWKPQIDTAGFYRVQALLPKQAGAAQSQTVTLVILPEQTRNPTGEFGWTLTQGEEPLTLGAMSELLQQAGVHWIKFPVWSAGRDRHRAERLVWFSERLSFQNIQMIGLLLEPPAAAPHNPVSDFAPRDALPAAADIFTSDPQNWYPSLEPVLTRLSLKVRWWQLGADHDTSFVNYPDLPKRITQLKAQLQRFNQELNLGFGWRWVNEAPVVTPSPWAFLSMSANPALTAAELEVYLPRDRAGPVKRWLVLAPLPKSQYALDTRVQDLAQRMMAAKIQRADAIFNPQPFDDECGLMNTDGTPGELFLPWRTLAMTLGGSQYVGQLTLPNGSENRVFARNGEAFMVVWSERPTTETLYLGEQVKQLDLFGRVTTPAAQGKEQKILVGKLPTLVTGLNEPIARLRMSFQFTHAQMPNIVGRPLSNPIKFQNFFPQGLSGDMLLVLPKHWKSDQERTANMRLTPGEAVTLPFDVKLPLDAATGRQPIRVDFNVSSGKQYEFSVYQALNIGQGDVELDVQFRFNAKGELQVEQHLLNHTDQPMRFKCQLIVPDRQVQAVKVQLEPGRDTKAFLVPRGRELIGKTLWLQAEEIDGGRVLNHRFTIEE